MIKKITQMISTLLLLLPGCGGKQKLYKPLKEKPKTSFYTLKSSDIHGKTVSMDTYKGKTIMVVNTASKCGYTYQYKALEKLSNDYKDTLVILGFPSNDFLGQEPGSNQKIENFCKIKFGVTFPLFEKIHVSGKEQSPIYQWLTDSTKNGWNNQKPTWNFCKYIINTKGELVAFFGSKIEPNAPEIIKLIK